MPDNPNIRGHQDQIRINVNQEHEVRYWCKTLGCTPEELREVIERVGPMVADVRRALKQ